MGSSPIIHPIFLLQVKYGHHVMVSSYDIDIDVETKYIPEESRPNDKRYTFAYTITMYNIGITGAQLMRRHWIIQDAHGQIQEVRGVGVVGEQPYLEPSEGFKYTSTAMIATPMGYMHGTYYMQAEDGTEFEVEIPRFQLSLPHTLH
ncbi:Co2+/Mg2+ efflux protein ApaG [Candidatus Albibeggiatoa sp. nov. BB20]|uniref:Co2+/Mg2+ efflux protein ApaG n=1 Tax=Candidatus Albibeggiatoa sp. nov. BB20 TaxID=3162723 RepID=UPI003365B138